MIKCLLYIVTDCIHLIRTLGQTPDATPDYNTDWLIYCSLIFDMLFQSYPVYIFPSMLTHYTHVHLSFYFCTLIGSSDSLDLHIQAYGCYILLIRFLERITSIWGVQSLFCSITRFFGTVNVFFLSCWFILILYCLNSILFYLTYS